MSKTLFWYVLRDLLRIFALTTLTLTGIMTFGGLLRPLTETGLETSEVGRLLAYMTPAMAAYCLPIAALFATTFVYGRFAADNELTAMRAGGIGFMSLRRFSMALPAGVLGLVTAVLSLLLLCFVVPLYTLKVEQVMYSNIAKVIAARIAKDHEMDFHGTGSGEVTVFAQEANLRPEDPTHPDQQAVELVGPAIVNYLPGDPSRPAVHVPHEFWLAQSAVVHIDRTAGQAGNDRAMLSVHLINGLRFPRQYAGEVQGGIKETTFGPVEIPSMVRENVKFMDIARLAELRRDVTQSQKVQTALQNIVLGAQKRAYVQQLQQQALATPDQMITVVSNENGGDTYRFGGGGTVASLVGDQLHITAPAAGKGQRLVQFQELHGSETTLRAVAQKIQLRCEPDSQTGVMSLTLELDDVLLQTSGEETEHNEFVRGFNTAMPPHVSAIKNKSLADFLADPQLSTGDKAWLRHEQMVTLNGVDSELHGRASFALSCLVLVLMGCPLGVMFKSGNFMTAFAVSFVPALLCITLMVCGQQVATHVAFVPNFPNPLERALGFIWTGNAIVILGAAWLSLRLQRR